MHTNNIFFIQKNRLLATYKADRQSHDGKSTLLEENLWVTAPGSVESHEDDIAQQQTAPKQVLVDGGKGKHHGQQAIIDPLILQQRRDMMIAQFIHVDVERLGGMARCGCKRLQKHDVEMLGSHQQDKNDSK